MNSINQRTLRKYRALWRELGLKPINPRTQRLGWKGSQNRLQIVVIDGLPTIQRQEVRKYA